jgi:hypothetical protein
MPVAIVRITIHTRLHSVSPGAHPLLAMAIHGPMIGVRRSSAPGALGNP